MTIAEADWKRLRKLHTVALERFCQRILDESQGICDAQSLTAHERYGKLYDLIRTRDKEIASAFDDLRRSTATLHLRLMVAHELLTEEELSTFSPDMKRTVGIEC